MSNQNTSVVIEDTGIAEDKYLIKDNVVHRLIEEYKKYGYIIVAYDFDDTIYDTYGKGNTYNQVIELLKTCSEYKDDFYMICFTVRSAEEDMELVKNYTSQIGINCDVINDNCPKITIETSRKILYNIFLDDKAGLVAAYEVLVGFMYWFLNEREAK